MLEDANSSQVFSYNTEFVNSNCTAFFAGLLRTSASSFTFRWSLETLYG